MAIGESVAVASAAESYFRSAWRIEEALREDAIEARAAVRTEKDNAGRKTRIMPKEEKDIEKPLSEKQKAMLAFIKRFIDESRFPPTIRDIQTGCGISSTSVVDYNLQILERRGVLRRTPDVSRGIELLGEHARLFANCARVPLAGEIARGAPAALPSREDAADCEMINVPIDMLGGSEDVYALRIKGDGFSDALMRSGDIMVLDRSVEAQAGDMVIAERGRGAEAGRLRSLMASANGGGDKLDVRARIVGLVRYC